MAERVTYDYVTVLASHSNHSDLPVHANCVAANTNTAVTVSSLVTVSTSTINSALCDAHFANNVTSACSKQPTIMLINATSLVKTAATEALYSDMCSYAVDAVIVCETWFRPVMSDAMFFMSNFNLYRKDRKIRKGGGVCIYVSAGYNSNILSLPVSSVHDEFELLGVLCTDVCTGEQFILLALYHPPKPTYNWHDLANAIVSDVESIVGSYPKASIIIGGDFNKLDTSFLTLELGLHLLETPPTHGKNTLDKIFVSQGELYSAETFKSLLKTKHFAVIAKPFSHSDSKHRYGYRKVLVYDMREQHISKLRVALQCVDFSSILVGDVSECYSQFICIIRDLLAQHIPAKSITLRPKDPPFITPLIRSLLQERCQLRKAGKTTLANVLATKINILIDKATKSIYTPLGSAPPKTLWRSISDNTKPTSNTAFIAKTDPDVFNRFFANASFDEGRPMMYEINPTTDNFGDDFPFSEIQIENTLRKLKNSSPGLDNIPSWVFRCCSVELASVVTDIFNRSVLSSKVPTEWLSAVVTPVPKVDRPSMLTDYRPISVTPLLARTLERLIVKKYISPAIENYGCADQYAFRPTGSTTCALVHLLHRVTALLETCNYVRCLLIDFSKAFDVVDRSILLHKVCMLDVPSNVKSWLANFLSNRTQVVKCNGLLSESLPVNLGVIQGSAVGPALFTVMVADLRPVSDENDLVKYADDMTLIVSENSDTDIATEFNAIKAWATANKLIINFAKTKEIVFHRPRPAKPLLPPPLTGIERVTVAKLLGVKLSANFCFSAHIDFIISQCSQRMFLLRSLRNRGLSTAQLEILFSALILSRILYAICSWGGFASMTDQKRVDAVLAKCRRYGYCIKLSTFELLLSHADQILFRKVQAPSHCLFKMLPCVRTSAYVLRERGHPFVLPTCNRELFMYSFINRSLFKFI